MTPISRSGLVAAKKSMAAFRAWELGEIGRQASDAQLVGKIAHAILLKGEPLEEQGVAIKPQGMSFATKEGKYWRDEQELSGKKIVKSDDFLDGLLDGRVQKSLSQVPCGKTILSDASLAEQDVTAEIWGIPFRGIFDFAKDDVIYDLKTTSDVTPQVFLRQCYPSYWYQSALYMALRNTLGVRTTEFVFVAVEKEPPFFVGEFRVAYSSPEILHCLGEIKVLAENIVKCRETGIYPMQAETKMEANWLLPK